MSKKVNTVNNALELAWSRQESGEKKLDVLVREMGSSRKELENYGIDLDLVESMELEHAILLLNRYKQKGRDGLIGMSDLIDAWSEDYGAAVRYEAIRMALDCDDEEMVHLGIKTSQLAKMSIETAANIVDHQLFHARQGHGFAAERANNLVDQVMFKDSKIVGSDNALNGADRLVDGTYIQSKYCSTGQKCIQACFDSNGNFRYYQDGSPMQIEVPSDKYEAAVREMERMIRNGKVVGVTDIKQAREIVRQGHFTYSQARNIAKAGTVESLTYDASTGMVSAIGAFGITTILSFAVSVWNGESVEKAGEIAVANGLKVGGASLVAHILSSQLGRTGILNSLSGAGNGIAKLMGNKAAALIVNAYREGGKHIYGAAASNAMAKLLNTNVITASITFAVFTALDLMELFDGKMSGQQFLKNTTITGAGVVAGTLGYIGASALAGAAVGTVIPVVGNIGGFIGGLIAGTAATFATKKVMDELIEDDSVAMIKLLNSAVAYMSIDYMINKSEVSSMVSGIKRIVTPDFLKQMYKRKEDAIYYAGYRVESVFDSIVESRNKTALPSDGDMAVYLRTVLNKAHEESKAGKIADEVMRFEQNERDDFEAWKENQAKFKIDIPNDGYTSDFWRAYDKLLPFIVESPVPMQKPYDPLGSARYLLEPEKIIRDLDNATEAVEKASEKVDEVFDDVDNIIESTKDDGIAGFAMSSLEILERNFTRESDKFLKKMDDIGDGIKEIEEGIKEGVENLISNLKSFFSW